MRLSSFFALLIVSTVASGTLWAQSPAPLGSATILPPNAIVTCAGGIQITFVPGANPVLTAVSASVDAEPPPLGKANPPGLATAPGLAVAISKTLRYIDKHGNAVVPSSIKSTERLQPISDAAPGGGLILQTVMVDRD